MTPPCRGDWYQLSAISTEIGYALAAVTLAGEPLNAAALPEKPARLLDESRTEYPFELLGIVTSNFKFV
jgi:hypothetical protein